MVEVCEVCGKKIVKNLKICEECYDEYLEKKLIKFEGCWYRKVNN